MIGRALTNGLGILALLMVIGGLYLAFFYAPPDALQGDVQRIMYIHVPAAWVAFYAFYAVFVASIAYLWKRLFEADRLAYASAEIGVLFTGLTLIEGAIWGKPTWGAWWTWDARLTTTALLFVIYIGYLMVRSLVEEPERRARLAAVVGIIGALDIPIIYKSVDWFRTLHQPRSIQMGGPKIAISLLVTVLLTFLVYIGYLKLRSLTEGPERRVRLAVLLAIVCALNAPIIFLSTYWVLALYQAPAMQTDAVKIAAPMLFTLLFNFWAYTLVYFFFLVNRVRLESLRAITEAVALVNTDHD